MKAKAKAEQLAVFTSLGRASLLLTSLQQESLAELDLSFVDYSVLRVLDREGPLAPTRLAEIVVLTTGGMTKVVDRLARRGLVERVPAEGDGRRILVRLTGEGTALGREASRAYTVGRKRVLRRLDPADVAAVDAALQTLVDAFEVDRR